MVYVCEGLSKLHQDFFVLCFTETKYNVSSGLHGLMFLESRNYFQMRAICRGLAVKVIYLSAYSFLNLDC